MVMRRELQEVKDTKTLEGRFDPNDPADLYRYWTTEFTAAKKPGGDEWFGIEQFQDRGRDVVGRYRSRYKGRESDRRLHLFPANIQTLKAILLGQVPKAEVERRYGDQGDDDARVAADILKRNLNRGIEDEAGGFVSVVAKCIVDRLLPGMGAGRVRFTADFIEVPETPAKMGPCPACGGSAMVAAPPVPEMGDPGTPMGEPMPCPDCQGSGMKELAPALPASEKATNEQADATYAHWTDILWSSARTFEEVRWFAFGADMSRQQLIDAFGEDEGRKVPVSAPGKKGREAKKETPWSRARVWEIWSKEHKKVYFYAEGHPRILFHVDNPTGDDPLGLEGFWPFPAPMMANLANDAFLPIADYDYAKALYAEVDDLTGRIKQLVKQIKAAGVYDGKASGLRKLLDEACENELVPVTNWGEFLKGGGLAGAFQLLPVKEMMETVVALVSQRNLVIENIYQVTGLGDIIRGQQVASETATTSAIKARYASVRLQDLQKEVARFATDLQRLRMEVMAKHWSIETLIERSAIMQTDEAKTPEGQQRILRAAQLIKDRHLDFRVVIKPEQISLQDWAQLKQQRSEVLQALGGYVQSSVPLIQLAAQAGPGVAKAATKFVLGTAQWLVAGMPGASGVETRFDEFVAEIERAAAEAAQAPPQPPPPDPKREAAMIKSQADVAKEQVATQGRLQEIAAETQSAMVQRKQDAELNVLEDQAKSAARLRADAVAATNAVTGGVP